MPDAATLQAARDVGGWVFATVVVTLGAATIIRWFMGLLERQTTAVEKLTDAVEALIAEVRASRRR